MEFGALPYSARLTAVLGPCGLLLFKDNKGACGRDLALRATYYGEDRFELSREVAVLDR